jgi:rare lipoprotein A
MRLGEQREEACRARLCAVSVACLVVAGCSGTEGLGSVDPRYGVSSSARLVAVGDAAPKGGGVYRVGAPYTVGGRTYVPAEDPHYSAKGVASWYGEDFHGRLTANGEVFDMNSMSAAHPTLPLPSYVRVTNISNGRSVILRVNDRGPFTPDRLIDVSVRAAIMLGFFGSGLAPVRVEYAGPAPLEGSDDNMLAATMREGEPAPVPAGGGIRLASARAFVPQMSGRAAVRNVPVPPERPYSLGEAQMHSNYRPANPGTTLARVAEPDRGRPALGLALSPRTPPLAAYAPVRSDLTRSDLPLPALLPLPAAAAGTAAAGGGMGAAGFGSIY